MRPIWTRSARQPSASVEPPSVPVRALADADRDQVLTLLGAQPIENLFVAARVHAHGLDPARLGCTVWGREVDGHLVSICHAGSNIVPIAAGVDDFDAYAHAIGRRRVAAALMGESHQVQGLWQALCERWGEPWTSVREKRFHQPLMVIDREPAVVRDPRVHRMTMDDYEAYFEAAVAMYTEEVGVSPIDVTGGYHRYVRSLIEQGRAFGILDADGNVIFKSDVGSALGGICQVQGVWLHPSLRGAGASIPAMARVVDLCRTTWPTVSLYVNDFNLRARRLYESVGFTTVGELATVLY